MTDTVSDMPKRTWKRTRRGGRGRIRRRGKATETAVHAWQQDVCDLSDHHDIHTPRSSPSYVLLPTAVNCGAGRPQSVRTQDVLFPSPGGVAELRWPYAASADGDDSDDESVCSRMTATSYASSSASCSGASSCSGGATSAASRWFSPSARPSFDGDAWATPFDEKSIRPIAALAACRAASPRVAVVEDDDVDVDIAACQTALLELLEGDAAVVSESEDDDDASVDARAGDEAAAAADRLLAEKAVARARHDARRRRNERKQKNRADRAAALPSSDLAFEAALAEHAAIIAA